MSWIKNGKTSKEDEAKDLIQQGKERASQGLGSIDSAITSVATMGMSNIGGGGGGGGMGGGGPTSNTTNYYGTTGQEPTAETPIEGPQ